MIIDGRTVKPGSTVKGDLCIIGAGPAGIALALEFVNTSHTVILLESGGLSWDERTQELASFEVNGPQYFSPKETRVCGFGGTTSAWAGICTPYDPMDFEERPWVRDSGWPICFETLAPYYERALRLCDARTKRDRSIARSETSRRVKWTEIYYSAPARFGKVFRSHFRSAPNLKCFLNSSATNLEMDSNGHRIHGTLVACIGGNPYRIQARRYVLAGGGIENARLLLASNDVCTAGIGNRHDVVGRYFTEHLRVKDRFRIPAGSHALAAHIPWAAGRLGLSRLQLSEEAQEKEKLLNYQATLCLGYVGQDSPQWEAARRIAYALRKPRCPYFPSLEGGRNLLRLTDFITLLRRPDHTFSSVIGAELRPRRLQKWAEVVSTVEQPPLEQKRVVLSRELDELDRPRARIIWSFSDLEERTYRRGLEITHNQLEKLESGIRKSRMEETDPWPTRVYGNWHHMGATRMHLDPTKGVVNDQCRVHEVANLFIAGSSVFTTGGVHSPTLTILALALRLADHLKAGGDAA